ncbi:MAG TPA: NADH-quinone oxidoreductase subunit J [Chloroflexota bacterium]|jgi:NAD(P)H-quinone oxidoreductase subunit 6|nr:NADH-quinone oxidoreductase subunit J [Chloroflexota bacterium]
MTTDSWLTLAFYVLAFLLVVGALGVVLLPRIVHAALALVFFFFITSGVYVLLQAEFIAATQVIIYVGAITVLFLFAIMLTNRSYAPDSNPGNSQWMAAALVALVTAGILLATFLESALPVSNLATPGGVTDVTRTLGELLMGPFLLPFEAAGLLLLAAMIGAIVIARET